VAVRKLERFNDEDEMLLLGDLVLMELLMGAPDEAAAVRLREALQPFPVVKMMDREIAESAARNYRTLRRFGKTIRGLVALVIGTYCIVHDLPLLHDDRDFEAMRRHLGLRVV